MRVEPLRHMSTSTAVALVLLLDVAPALAALGAALHRAGPARLDATIALTLSVLVGAGLPNAGWYAWRRFRIRQLLGRSFQGVW